jgi:hypothetical protein
VSAPPRSAHPYAAEIDAERAGWYRLANLVRALTPEECLVPGYQRDPDWTVRDVVAHLGTWLAEAETQLARMSAGTYEGHDVDIDAINESLLRAMHGEPWVVAWTQANAGRTRMLEEWSTVRGPSHETAWWVRKAGGPHYAEHLGRLQEWVQELLAARRQAGR